MEHSSIHTLTDHKQAQDSPGPKDTNTVVDDYINTIKTTFYLCFDC